MSYNIVLIGDELGLLVLEKAVHCFPNLLVKAVIVNEKRRKAKEVGEQVARRNNCELLFIPEKDNEAFCTKIRGYSPDLGLCYSFDRIIGQKILNEFHGNIFNIHGALLPKYRGANVLNWVLINGEKKTGITIHQMVSKLDAGDIAKQMEVKIKEDDTATTLQDRMNQLTSTLLLDFIKQFINGKTVLIKQDESQATYVRRRHPEDGFFSWNQDAREIYNLIRGLVHPWPGAWFIENGEKKIIDNYISYEEVVRLKNLYMNI